MQPFCTPRTHLLLLTLLLYFFVFSYQQVCNHHDQSTLVSFSENISTSSFPPLNWTSLISCCQWEGIECDINGRVTRLQLSSRGLRGVINSSISNLVMLTHLNLSNNYLHGSLVEEITRLKNLKIIDLSSNSFVGPIPQEIGKLLYLAKLHLYENSFSGPIPSSMTDCTHLEEILVGDNNLSGDISLFDFSKLAHLQKLDLMKNGFNGSFPHSIYSCKSLIAIRVAFNNLTGQISPRIIDLKSLSFLSLGFNSFTNIIVTLEALAMCKNLTFLTLSGNFNGEVLPVQRNFISSSEYQKLQLLALDDCYFKAGPIPPWLSNLKSLIYLSFTGNRLIGSVPSWLGTLPNIVFLQLSDNSLCGEIPLQVWRPLALRSQNYEAGLNFSQFELPIFFAGSAHDKRLFSIRYKANIFRELLFDRNAFSGTIPKEIGSLQNLQGLNLQGNHFSGHIPSSISDLQNLQWLDLSSNNLTGEIPTSLSSLRFLSSFNVSYNDLEGPIPTSGQLSTFQESSFEGNPGLCGEPINRSCRPPSMSREIDTVGTRDLKLQMFFDGVLVGFSSGFSSVLIFVASCVCFQYSKRRHLCSRRG